MLEAGRAGERRVVAPAAPRGGRNTRQREIACHEAHVASAAVIAEFFVLGACAEKTRQIPDEPEIRLPENRGVPRAERRMKAALRTIQRHHARLAERGGV